VPLRGDDSIASNRTLPSASSTPYGLVPSGWRRIGSVAKGRSGRRIREGVASRDRASPHG
jgi:hypothetical protein